MRVTTTILSVGISVILAACGGDGDDTDPVASPESATGGAGVEPEGSGGSGETEGPALPADLPDDVPVYENATPTLVLGKSFRMQSSDAPSAIHGVLEAELKAKGWEIFHNTELNMRATKDGRNLDINLIEDGGSTLIHTKFK